jgi:transposase
MAYRLKKTDSVALVEEMEGARRATGISSTSVAAEPAAGTDPEVLEKASRRRFTAKYKLRVLEQADGCTEPGQIGALLRREGLYSSHLTTWRRQREAGALAGLASRKRGCKVNPQTSQTRRMAELERDNERLRHRLVQAETIIDVQKKVSSLLGIPLSRPETD